MAPTSPARAAAAEAGLDIRQELHRSEVAAGRRDLASAFGAEPSGDIVHVELNLRHASSTIDLAAYFGWPPKQRLRFTKTGDSKLEEAYATHFVWPGKGPFRPPVPKEGRG